MSCLREVGAEIESVRFALLKLGRRLALIDTIWEKKSEIRFRVDMRFPNLLTIHIFLVQISFPPVSDIEYHRSTKLAQTPTSTPFGLSISKSLIASTKSSMSCLLPSVATHANLALTLTLLRLLNFPLSTAS